MWLNTNQSVMCDVGAKVACPVVFKRVDLLPPPKLGGEETQLS